MTEPQVWVLIGVFAAALFGVLGAIVPLITRTITAEIRGQGGELRGEIAELRGDLRGEISGLRTKLLGEIAELRGEVAASEHRLSEKIAALDGDVQAIARQVFGRGRDGLTS